jgi:hypothetical protein
MTMDLGALQQLVLKMRKEEKKKERVEKNRSLESLVEVPKKAIS